MNISSNTLNVTCSYFKALSTGSYHAVLRATKGEDTIHTVFDSEGDVTGFNINKKYFDLDWYHDKVVSPDWAEKQWTPLARNLVQLVWDENEERRKIHYKD